MSHTWYICKYIYTHTRTHTHISVDMRVYIFMILCIYIYRFMCIYLNLVVEVRHVAHVMRQVLHGNASCLTYG